jgi:hypothetical protein
MPAQSSNTLGAAATGATIAKHGAKHSKAQSLIKTQAHS